MECETEHKSKSEVELAKLITWKSSQQTTDILTEKTKATVYAHVATNAPLCEPDREVEEEDKVHERGSRAQELCESRGGHPGLPSLINLRFLWT